MAVDKSSADIVAQAEKVAQEGRNVTFQVLESSAENNKNNGLIKISNAPQSNIQNAQVP
jgi:hypothetical protein